jgi:hypothetical protein
MDNPSSRRALLPELAPCEVGPSGAKSFVEACPVWVKTLIGVGLVGAMVLGWTIAVFKAILEPLPRLEIMMLFAMVILIAVTG